MSRTFLQETVPALHQERAGESHTGTSDEASLMREVSVWLHAFERLPS
jgi:hypothetical protein